jgi:hypothetical protein
LKGRGTASEGGLLGEVGFKGVSKIDELSDQLARLSG